MLIASVDGAVCMGALNGLAKEESSVSCLGGIVLLDDCPSPMVNLNAC